MDIEKNISHTKLGKIIYSIQKSPESWRDWSCLYIDSPMVLEEDYEKISDEVDESMSRILGKVQGTGYITEEKNIMILCKDVKKNVLEDMAIDAMYIFNRIALSEFNYRVLQLPEMVNELASFHTRAKLRYINKSEIFVEDKTAGIKSILVVDDDPFTCKLLFNSLHNKHYIIVANNGEEALREYDKYSPDLVLLDINMPKLGGKEVLNIIVEANPNAKIVMFSSNDNVENISSCINDGAFGFLPKPFNRTKIEEYINSL